jgi:hypothetical protein
MTDTGALQAKLKLPPISQIGVVVKDVEKAAQNYSTLFGIGPFTIYEFRPENDDYEGEKMTGTRLKMGKAMWNSMELELIEPIEGRSPHMDWLRQRGEGVQHFGFNVPNFDDVCRRFLDEGFTPILKGEAYVDVYKGNLKACYFDTDKAIGVIFEIIWKSWLPECQAK